MALSTGLLCVQIGVLNLMSIMATISIFLYTSSGEKNGIHNPYNGWQWDRQRGRRKEEQQQYEEGWVSIITYVANRRPRFCRVCPSPSTPSK